MKILVLGCGPAGLLAAEAAEATDAEVSVLSKKTKSVMPGAQYLHRRIHGVTSYEPRGYLCVKKMGDAQGYAKKVYGDPEHPVSWDKYDEGYFPAWSLSEAYDTLWQRWEERIQHIDRLDGSMIRVLSHQYNMVLSTIPAPVLCRGGCYFRGVNVWFGDCAWRECDEDTIVYNGTTEDNWYRTSRIFGHETTEFMEPVPGAVKGFKPTETNCNCQPQNVVRLGRFGLWDKQILVHHAWEGAHNALFALQS